MKHNIESGTRTTSELLTFVNDIASSMQELMALIRTIEDAATVSSHHIGEQNKSVTEVSNVGKELADIAKELTLEFDTVFKAIQHADMG